MMTRSLTVLLGVWLISSGCATPRSTPDLDQAGNPDAAARDAGSPPVVEKSPSPGDGPDQHGQDIGYIDELPNTPPAYDEATSKLDWAHDRMFYTVQRQAEKIDGLFSGTKIEKERVPHSRFRAGMYTEVVDEQDLKLRFDPEFDMDLNLPNAEKRLKLFVTTEELDELPSVDPTDRDRGLRIGLERSFTKALDMDLGIKAKWEPELFAKVKLEPKWTTGDIQWYPGVHGFWDNEDGWGSKFMLGMDHWNGRALFRSVSGARWTEVSEGVEWDQSLVVGYARELLDERKLRKRASSRDLARGGGIRYTIKGHDDASFLVDEHRVTLFYKFPIRKKWLYGVLAPEVKFLNERDWNTEPGIKFGLDMLFWGMGER